jgi:hypothetical protein
LEIKRPGLAANRRYLRYGCVFALAFTLLAAGCKGKRNRVSVQNEEESAPRVASTVKMNDVRASAQLASGFYSLESNAWRWTAGKFSVVLRPPVTAPERGALLKFEFSLPDAVFKKTGPITLTASIQGTKLKPQRYSASGSYTYAVDVPPNLLSGETVPVDFALDKYLPPGTGDQRELGVIASSVGFEPK